MRSLAITIALAAGACADDPEPDTYDTARCLIQGNYRDLGTMAGTTAQGPSTTTIVLDPGPPRDSFFLKLTTGKGAFAQGLTTGTFAISGADADYNNCGLCTHIIADIVAGTGPQKFYFADAGSITLTATTPPAGSLRDLHLREINFMTGAAIAGGCEATIAAMTFSTN